MTRDNAATVVAGLVSPLLSALVAENILTPHGALVVAGWVATGLAAFHTNNSRAAAALKVVQPQPRVRPADPTPAEG